MGSYQLFQPLRPRRKPSTGTRLKRPPSLELQMNLKRRLTKARHGLIAVRGSISSPDKDSHPKEHTMPAQITEPTTVPSAVPESPGPYKAPGTKACQGNPRDQSQGESVKKEEAGLGEVGDNECSSPQESSIIDLDSLLDLDDSQISPLSDDIHLRSANRLSRFFPELSSHFSIVSPVGADRNMNREIGPTLFERELKERVLSLYRCSADVDPEINEPDRTVTRASSFDCASSCYSRRTSVTTVGTDFWGDDGRFSYKSSDAYSIYSPVAAGVFDDVSSLSPLRRPSTVPPQSFHVPDSIYNHQRPMEQVSMNDLKNKPLPLEPHFNPNSAQICHSESPASTVLSHSRQWSTSTKRDLPLSPPQVSAPMSHNEWKASMLHQLEAPRQPAHVWHGSEHNQLQPLPRPTRQVQSELQVGGQQAHHVPTLTQAAEELEDTLAGLADKNISPKALRILNGPPQIRRNGELIATRPAPLPPSTKPHSSPHSTPSKKRPKKGRNGRPNKQNTGPTKESRPKDRETWDERPLMPKMERNSTTSEDSKKEKMKKSFLAPFRKQSQVLRAVSARSEDSHMNSDSNAHVSRDRRLQLPRLQTQSDDLTTTDLLERVAEFISGSPGSNGPTEHNKMRQNWALVSTAQASSLQLTDQIYELPAEPSSPSAISPLSIKRNDGNATLPSDMPEYLIMSILENIDSLDDLFNFVLVSKKIYSTFKRCELPMIKNALFKMSPPAWELREMSPPWEMEWQLLIDPDSQVPEYTPTLYLQRYAQDIYTLAKLKALVLARCAPFLRRDTVRGLAGVDNQRAEEVDDAFWRVWTFCRIFGSGKRREDDLAGQMDWLKGGVEPTNHLSSTSTMTQPFGINNVLFEPPEGFGRGNMSGGLSQQQMYDMTEIWTCMGVLLQPLHGKCIEARKVGILDNVDVPEGDVVREEIVLEEWTSYIMTLGLGAVLALSSVCPADTSSATFVKAQTLGLTKWEPTETEASRSSFLKEAVSRAYELQERQLSSPTESQPSGPSPTEASREVRSRQTGFANELRQRRARGLEEPEERYSFSAERPMSEYSAILRNLDSTSNQPAAPAVPALDLDRVSSSKSGTAPETPTHTSDSSCIVESSQTPTPPVAPVVQVTPPPARAPTLAVRPQVPDPVDRAICMMVNELGFSTEDAKWALKITDTGEGIDSDAAVQLLQRQRRRNERNPFGRKDSLLSAVIRKQKSHDSGWRWA